MSEHRVAVIGGGLAGITAALRCADAGRSVVLFEAAPRLGGLTYSFGRGDLQVDNGQHVFLRCCTAYRWLLDRLGVTDQVVLQPRLEFVIRTAGARPARFRRGGLPAPLHLAGALLSYPMLSPVDRARAGKAALAMRRLVLDDPALDTINFGRWLAEHGQSEQSIAALWDLFTVAALNLPAREASLAMALKVFRTGLLDSRDGADIGWATVPLQQLHGQAAARALAAAGAEVRLRSRVDELRPVGSHWQLNSRPAGSEVFDQVVVATTPSQAERLVPAGCLSQPAGWSAALGESAIVNAHLVLDRPVMTEPCFAAVGSPVQWVFDRTEQSGLANLPGRAGQQYLAVSLSAADSLIGTDTATLRGWIMAALGELLPGLAAATVVEFFLTRQRSATFRAGPGTGVLRPSSRTRQPGLALAGAWTSTGWPATMEGAVRSGQTAAELLLAEPPDQRATDELSLQGLGKVRA